MIPKSQRGKIMELLYSNSEEDFLLGKALLKKYNVIPKGQTLYNWNYTYGKDTLYFLEIAKSGLSRRLGKSKVVGNKLLVLSQEELDRYIWYYKDRLDQVQRGEMELIIVNK